MRGQTGLPLWAAGVLAGLFVPVVVPFELVFGDGVGALAAGGGVVIGLLIAVAATRWRWDALTTAVAALAGYLLLGGPVALRGSAFIGQDVEVQAGLHCGKGLRAGGAVAVQGLLEVGDGLAAQGDIVCGNHIQAGWGIKARGDIRAACSIRAGETLQAEGEIAAGPGYGVFAGMNVQMDAWPDCAWVRALRKPQALISGWWEEQPAFA